MKNTLFAGIVVGAILSVGVAVPAQAGCRDKGTCANTIGSHKSSLRKQSGKKTYALSPPSRKTSAVGKKRAHAEPRPDSDGFSMKKRWQLNNWRSSGEPGSGRSRE